MLWIFQEKKEHDEVKKDLDAIKELNIEDLLPRKKTRPEDEIKGEYIEEEDVKVKTEVKENAEEDDDNIEGPRYSQVFFRMEAGQY